jgi:16S rRNA processing protein RimM
VKENLIAIGKIIKTQGNKGEVKVKALTDFPERFKKLNDVYLQSEKELKKLKIENVRYYKNCVILKFEEINSISSAKELLGYFLKVKECEAVKLPPKFYFVHDILNLSVFTLDGKFLGKVHDVLKTGSNDVYIVKGDKEYLIPAIEDVVKEINLKEKKIFIKPLNGLLEL